MRKHAGKISRRKSATDKVTDRLIRVIRITSRVCNLSKNSAFVRKMMACFSTYPARTRSMLGKRIMSIHNDMLLARQRCSIILGLIRQTIARGSCLHANDEALIKRALLSCPAEAAMRKIWNADIPKHPFPASTQQTRPPPQQTRPSSEDNADCVLRGIVGLIKANIDSESNPQSKKRIALDYLKIYHPDKVGTKGFGAIPQELFVEVTKVLNEYIKI